MRAGFAQGGLTGFECARERGRKKRCTLLIGTAEGSALRPSVLRPPPVTSPRHPPSIAATRASDSARDAPFVCLFVWSRPQGSPTRRGRPTMPSSSHASSFRVCLNPVSNAEAPPPRASPHPPPPPSPFPSPDPSPRMWGLLGLLRPTRSNVDRMT